MDYSEDTLIEPNDKLIRFGPEVVNCIRKEYNFQKKEDRENAIALLQGWVKSQDHLVKKDFSKGYIERCLLTCKYSIERAKKQIDTICTMRTIMPKYFETTNLKGSDVEPFLNKLQIGFMPNLTEEFYRVVVIKVKPNAVFVHGESTILFKLLAVLAEYLKSNECCQGFYFIADCFDVNAAEVLTKVNLLELQQFLPVLTVGYGCKIKRILIVTASKFIETFIKLVKPMFSEKVGNRIHAVSSRKKILDYVSTDCLPADFDGKDKPLEELHDALFASITAPSVQALLEEMNKATTDESKRNIDKFNEQYMGMPGTFRTLSLD